MRRFAGAAAASGSRKRCRTWRDDLLARVAEKLGGGVLQRRSGRLAAAVDGGGGDAPNAVSVSVGFDPAQVPYGAIQEFGGTTRAHIIAAKSARALAFTAGDRLVFAKRCIIRARSCRRARSCVPRSRIWRARRSDELALSVGAALDA